MAKPRLNREDCADIRRMYADKTRKAGSSSLAHLFRVTPATINKVVNGDYTPLEDYEEKIASRASTGRKEIKFMTDEEFDQRIARLTERHEALALSAEIHDHQIAALTTKIDQLIEENKRTARESRLFQRFVLNMGLRLDERISRLEDADNPGDGQQPPAAA